MDIRERAAGALVRAREAGLPVPATDPPYRQRLRAALTRDIATLLAVPATHVVVRDDPIRTYGDLPAPLITVHDPDDPEVVLCLLPETGDTGIGGGAYLLLDACPGCGVDPQSGQVPVATIYGLADLGYYQHCRRLHLAPPALPGEFFDDPAHTPDCPLRSCRDDHGSGGEGWTA
jgi:hypothetical protein